MNNCSWITPRWPAPSSVKALTTTRQGGASAAPYEGFNLGLHVNDDPEVVEANRRQLLQQAGVPSEPLWLTQQHGIIVVSADDNLAAGAPPEADACVSGKTNVVCAILTADCLPILLCHSDGTQVGAVHAGWKGLAAGIIEATLQKFHGDRKDILAWLGPAIGPDSFKVKEDVRLAFRGYSKSAFRPAETEQGIWFADLYALAREALLRNGVQAIFGGEFCTYQDPDRFYSFRRSGATGRMASLIWITPP